MSGSKELTSGSSVQRSLSDLPLGGARRSERGHCQLLPALESHHERLGDQKDHPPPPFNWGDCGPESRIHARCPTMILPPESMCFPWLHWGVGWEEADGKNLNGKMGRKLIFLEGSLGPQSGRRVSCSFKGCFLLMQRGPWTTSVFSSTILWIQGRGPHYGIDH